jgi:putative oxidoreductase
VTLGRLVFRLVVGALFVGHGTQKLFGWFGGGGPEETGKTFESAGLRPGRLNARAAGAAETAGGAMLALGLATPLAASIVSGVMLTAIRTVHWQRGLWNTKGGYEYPAVILAGLFALTGAGPGRVSLDAALGRERRGLKWAIAELAAAAIGSVGVIQAGRRDAAGLHTGEAGQGAQEQAPLRHAA